MNRRIRLAFLLTLFLVFGSILSAPGSLQAQNYNRSVTFEEFTGSWCGWCPYGAWNLDSIAAIMGKRAVIVSWHYGDDMQITAQDTVNTLLKVNGYPNCGIERDTASGGPAGWNTYNPWYQEALQQARKLPSVDFRIVNATYDPSTRKMGFDIDITPYNLATMMTEDTTTYVTVGILTEDGIVETQHLYNPADGSALPDMEDYVNLNVARAVGGKVLGDAFVMGTKTAITTYPIRKHYHFTLDPSWSDAGIRAKAFVAAKHKSAKTGQEVLNADQTLEFATALPVTPADAAWIVLPRAGDNLDPTTAHSIIWGEGGSTTAVKLEYSTDNAKTWESISSSTSASPYAWTIPTDAYGKTAVIRITDVISSTVTSMSDPFQIQTPTPASITVTAPSTGEIIATGTKFVIDFVLAGPLTESKTVELSTDSAQTWSQLGTVTGTTNTESWNVPTANTSTAFIRVRDGNNVIGMSGMFSIKPSVGQITSVTVAGAPNVPGNTAANISWSLDGTFSESLTLEWSSDNSTWNPIASGISRASSSYSWTTPNQNVPQAWVRVSVPSGIAGTSNVFAITTSSAVSNGETLPTQFVLGQNYPNPSNGISVVTYSIPDRELITLTISDLLGREVKRMENGMQDRGTYHSSIDMSGLPNGTYVYTLRANDHLLQGKMILAK